MTAAEFDVRPFKKWFHAESGNQTIMHGFMHGAGEGSVYPVKGLMWRLPPFQRPLVWTRVQQVRLIESLWAGLPIGSYTYNEGLEGRCEFWLIDGQQRWEAIRAYVAGEFEVHGHRFRDLPAGLQRRFFQKPFAAHRMDTADAAELEEVYNRLVYGGTDHEPVPVPSTPEEES